MKMNTDAVSYNPSAAQSAAQSAAAQNVVSGDSTFQGRSGEAFAALLKEVFASRMPQSAGDVVLPERSEYTPPERGDYGPPPERVEYRSPERSATIAEQRVSRMDRDLTRLAEQRSVDEMLYVFAEKPDQASQKNSGKSYEIQDNREQEFFNRLSEELGEDEKLTSAIMPWFLLALLGAAADGDELPPDLAVMDIQEFFPDGLPDTEFMSMEPEDFLSMLQDLMQGETPILDENESLTPQAGAVAAAILGDEKILEALRAFFLENAGIKGAVGQPVADPTDPADPADPAEDLAVKLAPGFVEGESKEQARGLDLPIPFIVETVEQEQPATLWEKLERFLKQVLSEEKEEAPAKATEEKGFAEKTSVDKGARAELGAAEQSLAAKTPAAPGGVVVEQPAKEGEIDLFAKPQQGQNAGELLFSTGSQTDETKSASGATSKEIPWQPREVFEQVMEKLTLLARPGAQELRMKLYPEFLGEILIKMRNVKGVLSAEIMTQDVAVKQLLEGNMDTLRQRFMQLDMMVDDFYVTLNENGGGGNGQEAREQQDGSDPGGYSGSGLSTGKSGDSYLNQYEDAYRVNYLA